MWKTSSPFFREVFPLLLKQSMSVSRYYKKSPAKSPHRKTDKKNKSSTILGHCTKRHQTITDGTTITTKLFKHSKHDLAGNPTQISSSKVEKNLEKLPILMKMIYLQERHQ